MIKSNWIVGLQGKSMTTLQIVNRIAENIGINDLEDFLHPGIQHINHPSAFKNIDIARHIFSEGVDNKRNFLIYADVDADGCTSAAIIYHYLKRLGITPTLHINKGKAHGVVEDFDINEFGNIDIVIIVDSLNSNMTEYHKILKTGAEIIILDHHVPSQEILDHQKILGYVSSSNEYPNPHLTGSGVCWQFIRYVDEIYHTDLPNGLADLAAVGIIGDAGNVGIDSMENRAICNMGFNSVYNPGIYSIIKKDRMDSSDIGYSVAPLVNAANRMDDNWSALNLFISSDSKEAKKIIKILEGHKQSQREAVELAFSKFDAMVEPQQHNTCYIFKVSECRNLSGLLATKAVDKYGKPCIVVTEGENSYDGSMRSTKTEDLRKMINDSGFAECNGHENSSGITIPKENLEKLVSYLNEILSVYEFTDSKQIDLQIERFQITDLLLQYISEFDRIAGNGFSHLKILIDGVMNYNIKELSDGKHLCVEVPDLKFLKWNLSDWSGVLINSEMSAVGTLSTNTFVGKKTVQMVMDDFNFSVPGNDNNLFFS